MTSAMDAAVQALLDAHFDLDPNRPAPPDKLPLAVPGFGREEVAEAITSLLTGWLTMGSKVGAFEEAWSEYIGVDHSIMVNSGSSALLVLFYALIETGRLNRGDEVLVPAVNWSTSLFSVAQAGLVPVLVDVDPRTLCVEGHRDRPLLAVHMLGNPSRATAPLLIEDACAAHGAEVDGVKVGSRGEVGAFSFFFSHHIATGEGGVITTDQADLADACRSLRAHGWIRERSDRAALAARYADIDPRFLFVSTGFNVRPTDLAGAFGVHQLRRLPDFVDRRNANHAAWCAAVAELNLPLDVFPEVPGTRHAGFSFPMVLHPDAPLTRAQLCDRLEARGIATRPISGSNLARQPAFAAIPGARVEGPLPVADAVHDRGLFVGNSHAFHDDHLSLLVDGLKAAFA